MNTVFNRSIFAKYFQANDAEAVAWAENVLDKLVADGIVAKYIIREDDQGVTDFEYLYRPIAIFFSFLVRLGREFRDFKDNDFLIDQYLTQHGHYTSGNESLVELAWSVENLLRRRSHRGSLKSIEKVDQINVVPTRPNGEVLELFAWDYFKFFKMGVPRSQYNGWNLNNSGPCGRGCTGRYDLNIGYENSEDVYSKDVYPLLNENLVFLSQYRGKNSLHISQVPFGQVAGIGDHVQEMEVVIDPRLNFEITFQVAQDITLENITFGCLAFDENGNQLSLKNVVNGQDDNFFFKTRRLNKAGKFYFVRGIIYRHDHPALTADQARLNVGFGYNLQFPEEAVSIIPYIVMDNNIYDDSESSWFDSDSMDEDSGDFGTDESGAWSDEGYDSEPSVYLWNIKVTPCSTSYNKCYLDNKNFIDIFAGNNNGKYTDEQIRIVLRNNFIPYNTPFNINQVGPISAIGSDTSYLLYEDGGKIIKEDDDGALLRE